jgi:hypothetical protein
LNGITGLIAPGRHIVIPPKYLQGKAIWSLSMVDEMISLHLSMGCRC